MPDIADLYDHEIAKVGPIWRDLMSEFAKRANTRANLIELERRAKDAFMKVGLVVHVRWENNLIVNPNTMQPYPIEIEILGRCPGASEDSIGFDHERKRHEVLRSIERGEDFYGQKEKARG